MADNSRTRLIPIFFSFKPSRSGNSQTGIRERRRTVTRDGGGQHAPNVHDQHNTVFYLLG